VTLEYPKTGGHVGFSVGPAFPPFSGRLDWLPQRILTFFDDTAMRAPAPVRLCEA
jgi:predicted alpha/beta-fold hydrolase